MGPRRYLVHGGDGWHIEVPFIGLRKEPLEVPFSGLRKEPRAFDETQDPSPSRMVTLLPWVGTLLPLTMV